MGRLFVLQYAFVVQQQPLLHSTHLDGNWSLWGDLILLIVIFKILFAKLRKLYMSEQYSLGIFLIQFISLGKEPFPVL